MIVDTFDSPLGKMLLCSDGENLTAVTFAGQKYQELHIPKDAVTGNCPALEKTKLWLSAYFRGEVSHVLPPIKPKGTAFQLRVWERLLEIPYGKTATYGQIANDLGCKSAQAVGGAVGRNPISILIPCHRVVGANGQLTGYAGGIEKKAALLQTEQKSPR